MQPPVQDRNGREPEHRHEHEHEHEHEHHGHEHHGHEHGHHEHEHDHGHGHHHEHDERRGHTGKITGLVYDRFGEFDGFLLDTEDGQQAFDAREDAVEELAGRAWAEGIPMTVFVDAEEPWRPVRFVLRRD